MSETLTETLYAIIDALAFELTEQSPDMRAADKAIFEILYPDKKLRCQRADEGYCDFAWPALASRRPM